MLLTRDQIIVSWFLSKTRYCISQCMSPPTEINGYRRIYGNPEMDCIPFKWNGRELKGWWWGGGGGERLKILQVKDKLRRYLPFESDKCKLTAVAISL